MNSAARSPTPSPRVHVAIHLVAGGVLMAASFLVAHSPDLDLYWLFLKWPLFIGGMTFGAAAACYRFRPIARLTSGLCVAVVALFVACSAAEGLFRLIGYDFRHQEADWRSLPPFFRRPLVPMAGAFFRRSGPEDWTGQVIKTYAKYLRMPTDPYDDEPVVSVHYDQFGFRNVPRPAKWEIAVAGDSFTELGHLRQDQLFTTILGQRLNRGVLNLGVSYTGPLSYLAFLSDYGVCETLHDVVAVFYEGNDIEDVTREYTDLRRYELTGQREQFQFHKQTSMLRGLGEMFRRERVGTLPGPPVISYFESRSGKVPMTLGPAPLSRSDLTGKNREALEYFFEHYAAFGKEHHVRTWLAYMPSKKRVLFDQVQFTAEASERVRNWTPSDLPQEIMADCARHGVGFIDLTEVLVEQTKKTGELMFNARYDLHLNALGALVVADELAKQLGPTQPSVLEK